jgi:hypothetical protein
MLVMAALAFTGLYVMFMSYLARAIAQSIVLDRKERPIARVYPGLEGAFP